MIMTPSGQVFSHLPAGFSENLTNFKVALSADQNVNSNLILNSSPVVKDEISSLQMTTFPTLTAASGKTPIVNGSIKQQESQDESSFTLNSEQTSSNNVTPLSEVGINEINNLSSVIISFWSLSFLYL